MSDKGGFREDSIKAWLLLLKAVDAVKDEIRHMGCIRAKGISPGQLGVLINLALTDTPPTQMELSRLLLVSKGNITAVLRTLERKGWVERKADPTDKRQKRIALTPKGRAVMKSIVPKISEKVYSIFGAVGEKNMGHLSEQLISLLMVFPHGGDFMESINAKMRSIKERRGGF